MKTLGLVLLVLLVAHWVVRQKQPQRRPVPAWPFYEWRDGDQGGYPVHA